MPRYSIATSSKHPAHRRPIVDGAEINKIQESVSSPLHRYLYLCCRPWVFIMTPFLKVPKLEVTAAFKENTYPTVKEAPGNELHAARPWIWQRAAHQLLCCQASRHTGTYRVWDYFTLWINLDLVWTVNVSEVSSSPHTAAAPAAEAIKEQLHVWVVFRLNSMKTHVFVQ